MRHLAWQNKKFFFSTANYGQTTFYLRLNCRNVQREQPDICSEPFRKFFDPRGVHGLWCLGLLNQERSYLRPRGNIVHEASDPNTQTVLSDQRYGIRPLEFIYPNHAQVKPRKELFRDGQRGRNLEREVTHWLTSIMQRLHRLTCGRIGRNIYTRTTRSWSQRNPVRPD